MSENRMTLQALPVDPPRADDSLGKVLAITVRDQMEPLEARWRRLETNPLTSLHNGYDWCKTWATTHKSRLMILEGRIGERTVFLLPLELSRSRGVKIARFIGADHSNIGTGLFEPDLGIIDPKAFEDALAAALAGKVDLVNLERMPLSWRGKLHPLAALPSTVNQNRAFQVPLLGTFEDTLKQVNAKRRRKKFRNQQRKLEDAGGYEIFSPETPAERHVLLDEFFRQKSIRFQTQGLPDVFRENEVRAFFHALLDLPAGDENYPLRLWGLRLKGEKDGLVLAIAGASRKGDHIICQFGSIREDQLPEASPGEFLFWHVIEEACKAGAEIFDFGIGDQAYKRSWCTVETQQYDLIIPLSAAGRAAAAAQRTLVRLKAAIKANKALYGFIQRLRAGSAPADLKPEAAEED